MNDALKHKEIQLITNKLFIAMKYRMKFLQLSNVSQNLQRFEYVVSSFQTYSIEIPNKKI